METTTILENYTTVSDFDYVLESSSSTTLGSDGDFYSDDRSAKSFTDYGEFDAANFINEYYLYLVCAIGIPGNIACIVIFTSMRPILSSSIYMMALAIADLIALALKMLYLQLTAKDIRLGDRGCQVIFMTGTLWQIYANWVLVALTVERFVAIWFPLKVRELCTKRNTLLVLAGMLLFFTLANMQFLFTYEEVADSFLVWDCRPKPKYATFIQYVWYWIDGALYAVLPIILIMVFNILIITAVRRSGQVQRALTNGHGKPTETLNHQRQITAMLLTTSIIFVVLVLPNSIFFVAKEYWTWRETSLGIAQYYLLLQIIFLLSDLSHALNFYLYCLSGRKFRQKFLQLVCPCIHRDDAVRRPSTYLARAAYDVTSSGTHISTISASPNVTPTKQCQLPV